MSEAHEATASPAEAAAPLEPSPALGRHRQQLKERHQSGTAPTPGVGSQGRIIDQRVVAGTSPPPRLQLGEEVVHAGQAKPTTTNEAMTMPRPVVGSRGSSVTSGCPDLLVLESNEHRSDLDDPQLSLRNLSLLLFTK